MNNLTFKCINDDVNIKLIAIGEPYTINLKFRINDGQWDFYRFGDVISLQNNQELSFLGDINNKKFSKDLNNYYQFVIEGKGYIIISGNINSLTQIDQNQIAPNFNRLFEECNNIVDASQLELSFNKLSPRCYARLFCRCKYLLNTPQLPAINLAQKCYQSMFKGCSVLSITPSLPATKLVNGCYKQMFENCIALTAAPQLPALNLVTECYNSMFYGCTNLKQIEVKFLKWNNYNATDIWLANVSKIGIFKKPDLLQDREGNSYIPRNWNIVNETIEAEEQPESTEPEVIEEDTNENTNISYTAGNGLLLNQNNQFSLTGTILSAGTGISIENNTINLTGTILSAGEGISIENNIINLTTNIPTKISDLENDSNFITEHQDLSEYAKIVDLPRKYSDLNDDKHFMTQEEALSTFAFSGMVPTKVSQLQNDVGVVTNNQFKEKLIDLINNDQEVKNLIITILNNN